MFTLYELLPPLFIGVLFYCMYVYICVCVCVFWRGGVSFYIKIHYLNDIIVWIMVLISYNQLTKKRLVEWK